MELLFHTGSEGIIQAEKGSQGNCLSEECITYCTYAASTLVPLLDRIANGSITFQDIEKVLQKESQFLTFCASISQDSNDMQLYLECRSKEHFAFIRLKNSLGSFCQRLEAGNLHVEGNHSGACLL